MQQYDRLQGERITAFKEFRDDVEKGAFPEDKHRRRSRTARSTCS